MVAVSASSMHRFATEEPSFGTLEANRLEIKCWWSFEGYLVNIEHQPFLLPAILLPVVVIFMKPTTMSRQVFRE